MAWIESHQALRDHPKVFDLADRMGWSEDETIGKLHRFWWWCIDYAIDGNLTKFTPTMLAQGVGIPREHGELFLASMIASRWIDHEPILRIHDWWDYAGRYLQVRFKHKPAIWKKISISYKSGTKNRSKNSPYNRSKNNKPDQTGPNPIGPNQTQPDREEKSCTQPAAPRPGKGVDVWNAYAEAYRTRYGVAPVRNQSANAMLCRVVDKLGQEEAPQVASFYLTHPGRFYVEKMHPINLLLNDAEKLRTEWATGQRMTATKAQQADGTAERANVFMTLLDKARAKA